MAKYRVPVLETFSFQPPVLDKDLTAPPATPSKGDRYIVGGSATGDWATHDKDIAYYDGAAWQFDTPAEGWITWVSDEDLFYKHNGTAWATMGGTGDMSKATYDTDDDGIVDKAENVDDGAGSATTAAQVKDAHARKATYDSDYKCLIFDNIT